MHGLKIAMIPLNTQAFQSFSPGPPQTPPTGSQPGAGIILPLIPLLLLLVGRVLVAQPAGPEAAAPPPASVSPAEVAVAPAPAPAPEAPVAPPAARPPAVVLPAAPSGQPAPEASQLPAPAIVKGPLAQVLPYGGADLWMPVVAGLGLIGVGLRLRRLARDS